ncbi:MAG: universal stress protein [Pseudomonadota bacterium]
MKILAAVDRSEFADRVVDLVRRIASEDAASILLLSVAPRQPDVLGQQLTRKVITDPVPEDLLDRRALLDRLAEVFAGARIPCETLMVRGKAAATIIDEAIRWDADLIVVGSHGRGMLMKQVLGSVSEEVLEARRLPVLVVPFGDA